MHVPESRAVHAIPIQTELREQMVDVTELVEAAVRELGVVEGAVLLHVPHTTAAVTVNEGYDPDVARDLLDVLQRLAPRDAGYRHAEGNSDAHAKALLTGGAQVLPVEAGRLVLGRWQRVFFCEFDGPRRRRLWVSSVAG